MSDPVSADAHVRVEPTVYARAFGGELVLLDFGSGEYYALDEIGAEIWRRIEAGEALGEVADAIARSYEVSRDQASRDIVALVTQMRDRGLIKIG
jgi:hypothetical protein